MINIGPLATSDEGAPLVVAEIGANHDGDPKKASAMIQAIAQTDVRALKFQFYSSEELISDRNRIVHRKLNGVEYQEKTGKMFDRLSLSFTILKELFTEARELGLVPFATPFSEEGANLLLELDVPCFKIAASDVTHLPLLKHVASLKRPVILSLGKCNLSEADHAIECLFKHGCKELILMHCVAAYPSPMNEMNLKVIPTLKNIYPECIIGFSDHSFGNTAAVAGVALGARMIEKHVTLDKNAYGPDHWFSLDMKELQELSTVVHNTFLALGHPRKKLLACENSSRQNATRSLVAARDLKAKTKLSREDLKTVRPGGGISTDLIDVIQGMSIACSVKKDTVLTWDMFKS